MAAPKNPPSPRCLLFPPSRLGIQAAGRLRRRLVAISPSSLSDAVCRPPMMLLYGRTVAARAWTRPGATWGAVYAEAGATGLPAFACHPLCGDANRLDVLDFVNGHTPSCAGTTFCPFVAPAQKQQACIYHRCNPFHSEVPRKKK